MNKFLSFLIILCLVLLCACRSNAVTPSADGSETTKSYNVDKFTTIEVMNSINVKYSQGKTTKVTVTADPVAFEYLKVQNKGNRLKIYFDYPNDVTTIIENGVTIIKSGSNAGRRFRADVQITSPELKKINAFNSVDFVFITPFKGKSLHIDAFNSADIDMKQGVNVEELHVSAYNSADIEVTGLECEDVNIAAFNSADVELSGKANTVSFSAYNSAEIEADHLTAKSGSASAFNGATIECNVANLNSSKFNGGSIKNKR